MTATAAPTSTRPRRGPPKWVIALILIAIVAQLGTWVAEGINSRAIYREITTLESQATTAGGKDFTREQAVTWLQQNGFTVIHWNPYSATPSYAVMHTAQGTFDVIQGHRASTQALLKEKRFIELTFRWKRDGTFLDIKGERRPFDFIGFKPTTQNTP